MDVLRENVMLVGAREEDAEDRVIALTGSAES